VDAGRSDGAFDAGPTLPECERRRARLDGAVQPRLLFCSGFESPVTLGGAAATGTFAWTQVFAGEDVTGFPWPPRIWGAVDSVLLMPAGRDIRDAGPDVDEATRPDAGPWFRHAIETTGGRTGAPTRALRMEMHPSPQLSGTQSALQLNKFDDNNATIYVRYWVRFDDTLPAAMEFVASQGRLFWLELFAWKSSAQIPDRLALFVEARPNSALDGGASTAGWTLRSDLLTGANIAYWIEPFVPGVPVNRWFLMELFARRGDAATGEVRVAIDGQLIITHHGEVRGEPAIGALIPLNLYHNAVGISVHQWIDDIEIWDGVPCAAMPCADHP